MTSRFAVRVALFTIIIACVVRAQINPQTISDQNRTGDLPYSATIGTDVERVDLATGNLTVKIPFIDLKGRGLPYGFMLHYNANFWQVGCSVDINGNYYCAWGYEARPWVNGALSSSSGALGWEFNVGTRLTPTTTYIKCGIANIFYVDHYMFEDPSGGKHLFATQTTSSPGCTGQDLQGPDLDGLGMWMNLTGSPLVYDAGGTLVSGVKDSNGNQAGEGVNALDTLGRTIVTEQTGANQYTYTVHDSNGSSQNYIVNLANQPLCTQFGFAHVDEYCNLSHTVITSIVLPTGRKYSFQYDPHFGDLTEIDLPTGAVITYTWQVVGTAGIPPTKNTAHRVISSRTVTIPGQTAQLWTLSGFTAFGGNVTVTDPLNNQSVYNVSMGTVLSAAFYNGSATGNPVRQYTMDYASGGCPLYFNHINGQGGGCGDANIGNRLIRVTTTLDNGQVSKKEYDYETFTYIYHTTPGDPNDGQTYTASRGNVSEIREYDYGTVPASYGSGTPGPLLRRTDKTYLHNSDSSYLTYNIVDKVLQDTTYDSTANTCQGVAQACSQTQYEYDNYVTGVNALISTNAAQAPQHDYTNYSSTFTHRGNLTRVKRWRNTDGQLLTTIYTYDDLGNIRAVQDPLLNPATTWSYTDSFSGTACPVPTGKNGQAYPTQMTDALNHRVQATYFPCTGLLQALKDENDIQAARAGTTYVYDLFGRITQKNFPDTGQVANSYNDVPPVSVTTTTKITSSLNWVSVGIQDGLGRVTQTQITSDPDGATEVDTTLDALGRISSQSNPHRSTSSSTDGTTTNYYDVLGRVCLVVPPDGTQPSGSICPTTRPVGDTFTTYSGNCTTVTDEAGKSRKSCSDGLGRLIQLFEDPATLNYETDYGYDALGNLMNVNQKGGDINSANWRTRAFTYNSLSQLLTANNPESGAISYAYDNDGNLLTKVSPAPNQTNPAVTQTISYCYDQLNRLTGKAYSLQSCPLTTPAASYFYDQTSYNGLTIANGIGKRTGMSDGSGATAWSYDITANVGWRITERRTINSVTKNIVTQNSLSGATASITYPSSSMVTFTLGAAGRPLSAVDTGNAINYVTAATYAPQGSLYQFTNGGSISGAITYNSRLQPLQLYFTAGTISPTTLTQLQSSACPTTVATIMSRSYNFGSGTNDNGNVQNITNCRTSNRTQNFAYDSLNRITQAYTTGTNWGEDFTIDPWGNLTNRSLHSGKTNFELLNAAPATNNKLTGFGYDAAGNMTSNGSSTYTYDAENRLVAAGGVTYTYDGDGNRVKKSTGTLYWGAGPLAESDLTGSAASWNDYVFFSGKRVARRNASNVHYYFSDHLGSSDVVTSSAGSVLQDMDYYPYGGTALGTSSDHYLFTGKERDSESGLDNFGKRYDASSLGRFMTPDAFYKDSHVADPQSWNEYAYARNNPLRYVDPTGENATVSTNCTTTNNQTTCNVNISASISIYAEQGSNISQQQLNQAATDMKSSIEGAWTGSFAQDGVTYNVTTQVNVSVAGSEQAAMGSGAQNVIGMTNGPPQAGVGAFVNPKSFMGMLTGAADTGKMDINNVNNYAKHEFTHLLGTFDKPGAVLSNTDPAWRPFSATSQDYGWGIREATRGVNGWMNAPAHTNMRYGEQWDKPSAYSGSTDVGAPWHWWK